MFAQLQAGEFDVDEDLACAMYEELIAHATRRRFPAIRDRQFCAQARSNVRSNSEPVADCRDTSDIPTFACRHNVNYWRGGSFYGLGPSATGYVRGVRTKNWSNTPLYCEQLEKGKRAIESREELPPLRGPAKPPRSVCA